MEFSSLVEKIKNIKPHREDHGYHKSLMRIVEKQTDLLNLIGKIYKEQFFVRGTFEKFVNDLVVIISKGRLLKESNDSIKNYLEHYLLQYSSLQIENDENLKMIKLISFNIMNSYNDFLFIVKLLDNDFLLTGVVKVLIGQLNSDLLKNKIYIRNFK